MKKLFFILLGFFAINSFFCKAQTRKDMYEKLEIKMFPKAEQGFKQVHIQVPIKKNEDNYKVELFIGIEKEVDCNNYFLAGTLKEKDLEGWGYTYYNFESNGNIAGTLMGCPDNKKVKKFITVAPTLVRYNSRLPIVLYVPQNIVVKYRIWSASEPMYEVKVTKK